MCCVHETAVCKVPSVYVWFFWKMNYTTPVNFHLKFQHKQWSLKSTQICDCILHDPCSSPCWRWNSVLLVEAETKCKYFTVWEAEYSSKNLEFCMLLGKMEPHVWWHLYVTCFCVEEALTWKHESSRRLIMKAWGISKQCKSFIGVYNLIRGNKYRPTIIHGKITRPRDKDQ
jgi:hypothetical protein